MVFITSSVGTLWVYNFGGDSFLGVFLDQRDLSFGHPFGYICFFEASIHFGSQSVMNGSNFFKPESMSVIMAWSFSIWYFSVLFCVNRGVFSPYGLLRALITLFPCCLSIQIFCYYLSVPICCSKIVLLPSHPVVGMSLHISPSSCW